MHAFVYASHRRPDAYLWLRQRDAFDDLPDALREQLGDLRFVLELDLDAERTLPNADAAAVLAKLTEQGWYLQLPPADATAGDEG